MFRNVFLKTLRDQRNGFMWWGIGLVALALYMMLLYPTIRETGSELEKFIEQLPPALKAFMGGVTNYAAPEGYLNAELFSFMVPILFLFYTIGFGSGAIAGEEEHGTLDLLLSNPLPRWRVIVQKFAALVVSITFLAFVFWLGLAFGAILVDMKISLGRLAEAIVSAILLGLTFGTLALALGCIRGSRGLSIGLASALSIVAYLVNALSLLVEGLKPYRVLSPFYYYSHADPLTYGLNLEHAAILIGITLALLAVALFTFQHRDIAV